MPGVMLRYTMNDERLIGITAHDVSQRLSPDTPQDIALRQLVQDLVKELA